jgi:uncharacterized protein (TIGR00369 family)
MADKIVHQEATDGFTRHAGIEEIRVQADGQALADVEIGDEQANQGGWAHGGLVATLLDAVLGAAVVASLGADEWCATEHLDTDFMRPGREHLTGVGRLARRGSPTAFASGEATDAEDRVVARGHGVWAIRRE